MCPKPATSWCHFVQRADRSREQRLVKYQTKIGFDDEKFSYVVLRKAPRPSKAGPPPVVSLEADKSVKVLGREARHRRREQEKDEVTHFEKEVLDVSEDKLREISSSWPRMVAEPVKRKEHVILDLCTTGGLIRPTVGKSKGGYSEQYKLARKGAWGDLYPYSSVVRR